jgi:hypothetical protein
MDRSIGDLDSRGLMDLVNSHELDELEALQVLRSPFCTPQIAEAIASNRRLLDPHGVREMLAGFPGFNFSQALDLLATLPWVSLLTLSQAPKTPPVVRRHAERKLKEQLPSMALGEKIALARRAHRALFRMLTASGDQQVLVALLNNPRLVENDILVILNTVDVPADFLVELVRHSRWGSYRGVRRAVVESDSAPLPLALSVLVQLTASDLRQVVARKALRSDVRDAARSLLEREARGLRGVILSSSEKGDGGDTQTPEDLR